MHETAYVAPATPTSAPASTGLFAFVKAQLAAGHITKAGLEKYTPQITEEVLINNYVNAISQF